jgi:hypothetical protein
MYAEIDAMEQIISSGRLHSSAAASSPTAWEVEGGVAVAWAELNPARHDLLFGVFSGGPGDPLVPAMQEPMSLIPRIPNAPAGGSFPLWPQMTAAPGPDGDESLHLIWTHERLDVDMGLTSTIRYTRLWSDGPDPAIWSATPPVDLSDDGTNVGGGAVAASAETISAAWVGLGGIGPGVGAACNALTGCNDIIGVPSSCPDILSIALPPAFQCVVDGLASPASVCDTVSECVFMSFMGAPELPEPDEAGLVIKRGDPRCGAMRDL